MNVGKDSDKNDFLKLSVKTKQIATLVKAIQRSRVRSERS